MKLSVKARGAERKSESKAIRREGNIPAIIYGKGKENEPVAVNGVDFEKALRESQKGHLPTIVFTLVGEDGSERKALVKDVQYHRTTYKTLHLDLEELQDDVPVQVNIPIEFTGAAECAGIKLGGVLRKVIRRLRVKCLPKDLPAFFELDVRELALKGTRRLADIALPAGVQPQQDLNEVAVVIAKR
jgi:large subunit ribosomal protein L25